MGFNRGAPTRRGALALGGRGRQAAAGIRSEAADRAVDNNPFGFEQVKARIDHALREHEGRYAVVPLPNITNIFYRRDVGYAVERIELAGTVEGVSATNIRRALFNKG